MSKTSTTSKVIATIAAGLLLATISVSPASAAEATLGSLNCNSGTRMVESRSFTNTYTYHRHIMPSGVIRVKDFAAVSPSTFKYAAFGFSSVSSVVFYADGTLGTVTRYCTGA